MPEHLWLDWRLSSGVEALRRTLPAIVEAAGYQLVERQLLNSGPGWATFDLGVAELGPEPIGSLRAQDVAEGGSQLFITAGARRDDDATAELNRAALALYCGLIARAMLAPPPPLEAPARPLVAPEA